VEDGQAELSEGLDDLELRRERAVHGGDMRREVVAVTQGVDRKPFISASEKPGFEAMWRYSESMLPTLTLRKSTVPCHKDQGPGMMSTYGNQEC
jgi:hypothetical protein